MFENVLEVLDHQFNGRVHIVPTISAEEASSKVDADNAAGFTDCSQLTVDEISRMRAQGMRIGVRGDEGRIADSGNVPETATTGFGCVVMGWWIRRKFRARPASS